MDREDSAAPSRWHLWLPAVAAVASVGMVFLAATATNALEERNDLALEGRVLGVAHRVESQLRDEGSDEASSILEEQLSAAGADVVGLALAEPNGNEIASTPPGSRAASTREIELFVGRGGAGRFGRGGPSAAGGGPRWGRGRGRAGPDPARMRGGGVGRMILRVHLAASATRAPLAARLLLPVTAVFAVALFALALFGARLLQRQHVETQRAAARRRLEALGRAGAGLAHQLRTPLATIKGASQLLKEEAPAPETNGETEPDPTVHRRVDTILEQVERMQRMVGRLLDYARPPRPEPRDIAVADIASEVTGETEVSTEARVRADPEHLREILEILVDNAREASPTGVPIEVSAEQQGERIVLFVRDRGAGPGDDPEHLFEPYVSGRASGTGLGLPIARTLAEANGGTLRLSEREGGGCEAALTLPRSAQQ